MNLSFVRFAITFIIAKKEPRKIFTKFLDSMKLKLSFKLPRSMVNLYRNQRGWAEVEIGVISPYANKRIITPILETVRSSPRFIGGLVSSIVATIIADIINIFVHTCPNFLQL